MRCWSDPLLFCLFHEIERKLAFLRMSSFYCKLPMILQPSVFVYCLYLCKEYSVALFVLGRVYQRRGRLCPEKSKVGHMILQNRFMVSEHGLVGDQVLS